MSDVRGWEDVAIIRFFFFVWTLLALLGMSDPDPLHSNLLVKSQTLSFVQPLHFLHLLLYLFKPIVNIDTGLCNGTLMSLEAIEWLYLRNKVLLLFQVVEEELKRRVSIINQLFHIDPSYLKLFAFMLSPLNEIKDHPNLALQAISQGTLAFQLCRFPPIIRLLDSFLLGKLLRLQDSLKLAHLLFFLFDLFLQRKDRPV